MLCRRQLNVIRQNVVGPNVMWPKCNYTKCRLDKCHRAKWQLTNNINSLNRHLDQTSHKNMLLDWTSLDQMSCDQMSLSWSSCFPGVATGCCGRRRKSGRPWRRSSGGSSSSSPEPPSTLRASCTETKGSRFLIGPLTFFPSTSQTAHLLLCLPHRWHGKDLFSYLLLCRHREMNSGPFSCISFEGL